MQLFVMFHKVLLWFFGRKSRCDAVGGAANSRLKRASLRQHLFNRAKLLYICHSLSLSHHVLCICEQQRLWRDCVCTGSPEPSLFAGVISAIFICNVSYYLDFYRNAFCFQIFMSLVFVITSMLTSYLTYVKTSGIPRKDALSIKAVQ